MDISLDFLLSSYSAADPFMIGHVTYTVRCERATDMINLYAQHLDMLMAVVTVRHDGYNHTQTHQITG